jgi:hypothetical protein
MLVGDWFSQYGVPGRVSAALTAFVTAVILAAKGKFAATFVLLIVVALMLASAWHYKRTH